MLAVAAISALPGGSLVVALHSGTPTPAVASAARFAAAPPTPIAPMTSELVYGSLFGVNVSGGPEIPIPGAVVYAGLRPCPSVGTCASIDQGLTSGDSAEWSLLLPPGNYFLWSSQTGPFGGADEPVSVDSADVGPIRLVANPYLGYSNRTELLPAWNSLSSYAANCNAALPCHSGSTVQPYGSQVPLLSWTQDGVFYVNATLELVFYSFVNQSVRPIAPWLALYDDVMDYEGVENTEWITADGSYVYEFGCAQSCTDSSSIIVYAVNTTTGRSFTWNVSGLTRTSFANNGQVDLIGEQGNHSVVALTDDAGVVTAYNLWNETQWTLATIPFFEANNLYWVDGLDSYFDIEAQNDPYDWVVQLELTGPYPGTTLTKVGLATYGDNYPTGGINGLAFNATSGQVIFTAQSIRSHAITSALDLQDGTLASLQRLAGSEHTSFGFYPNTSTYPNIEASEHRPSYLSNGPAFAGYWDGYYNNTSAFVNPVTGTWYDENLTFDHTEWNGSGLMEQHQLSPAALEGLFYNTSYSLIPYAYDCRTNNSECAINGPAAGTVWWTWQDGLPEFPFPATAPIAETQGPGLVGNLTANWTGSALTVNWTPPADGGDPLVNYTLFLATSAGDFNESVSLPPTATNFSITPPRLALTYFVRVEAWNLHWHGPQARASANTTPLLGELNLTVSPAWASVSIDGSPIALEAGGVANLTLAAGSHTLHVSAVGYQSLSEPIEVPLRNVTSVSVALVGVEPVLAGTLTPTDGAVDIDGDPVGVNGTTGGFFEVLSPGTYTVTASAYGFDPFGPIEVNLSYGGSAFEPIVLAAATGEIRGSVAPSDALVTLDGAPVGTPNGLLDLSVDVGTHELWAGEPGYLPEESGSFLVAPGAVVWVNLTLRPFSALWVITANPSNATISIDGTSYLPGEAASGIPVAPGPHQLNVTAPGYNPFETNATAGPNATSVWQITLNRTTGWLLVTVHPADARLSVDGAPVPATTSGEYNLTLPVGRHDVSAAVPGGASVTAEADVLAHAGVSVALVAPSVPSNSALPWVLAGAVGAAVGGGAVYAVSLLRRRKPSRPSRPVSR